MQMSVGASCFLAWLPDEGAAEILTSHPTPIVAGTLFPGRQAIPVDGGYRLRGQWPFVTGSHDGHWFMCLPQIMDGGQPRGTAQGRPVQRFMFLPADQEPSWTPGMPWGCGAAAAMTSSSQTASFQSGTPRR